MTFRVLLLSFILLFLAGCSMSSLNPFHTRPYYIEGEAIPQTVRSGATPHRYVSGGYTSKARQRATMKTYVVGGRVYHPTYVGVGDSMRGIASWYGPNFHGKQTSNGEIYNMYGKTIAHKTWPMDTMVKVTNLDNGRSTIARVNDRGPFVAGRVADCSYAVGKEIGIDKKGICRVKLQVVGFAGKVYHPSAGKAAPKVRLTDFGVQVGAFAIKANALALQKRFKKLAPNKNVIVKSGLSKETAVIYRVHVMGFGSEDEARDFIASKHIDGGFIIRK